MLKTVNSNRKCPLPLRLFEVGDIVVQDPSNDRRCRNERHVCVLYSNRDSGFELVHGVLDRLMTVLDIPQSALKGYSIKPSAHPTFFPGRQADLLYRGRVIGSLGIIHPECLEKFELHYPVSCLEFNLEPFL